MIVVILILGLLFFAAWLQRRGRGAGASQGVRNDSTPDYALTEKEAAYAFVVGTLKKVERDWPAIKASLTEGFDIQIEIPDIAAKNELAVFLVALENRALKNIFPAEQAERLRRHAADILAAGFGKESLPQLDFYAQDLSPEGMPDALAHLILKWRKTPPDQLRDGVELPGAIQLLALQGVVVNMSGAWLAISQDTDIRQQ